MAIYIEDMNMPPEGSTFLVIIHSDGKLTNLKGAELKATATSVPYHGDLIDRDKLIEEGTKDGAYGYVSTSEIGNAPVIIPGDKEIET